MYMHSNYKATEDIGEVLAWHTFNTEIPLNAFPPCVVCLPACLPICLSINLSVFLSLPFSPTLALGQHEILCTSRNILEYSRCLT